MNTQSMMPTWAVVLTLSLTLTLTVATRPTTITATFSAEAPSPSHNPATCDGHLQECDLEPLPRAKPVRREVYGNGKIFDITHQVRAGIPLYKNPLGTNESVVLDLSINGRNNTPKGWTNNSKLKEYAVHFGTHVDAPSHSFDEYYDDGFDVDAMDLETLNGPALVVDVPRNMNITAEALQSLQIPKGVRRVIFKTLNTDRHLMWRREFHSDFIGFTTCGAKWLVDNTDIKLIGIDYITTGVLYDLVPVHKILLRPRDIVLVEGLKLDGIEPGHYTVNCLPMRLPKSDGAPTRCILVR
ncbi:hypothetical protein RJ640_021782 [Escallonia rubra]|uniref:Cyclase n=1 Tax=Escallonia rubra TaxID=112253 RepID=A0AA88S072_9ASTE|nr:hypothetical protein RJ640_021782 [Escallonia rubra]